jgi:hypothetical protein
VAFETADTLPDNEGILIPLLYAIAQTICIGLGPSSRGDRFRIGNVASKGVNFWKGRFRTVHLCLIAARDKNRVTKRRELFGEFVTDAAGTAGDQNRIAREFQN